MEQNTLKKQRELIDRFNRHRNEYYNCNNPSVGDGAYDRLFSGLHKLERETGVQMSNSPIVTAGYPMVGKLEKAAHRVPLLSLGKVESSVDLCRFMDEHQVMIMLRLGGLTTKLVHENGELVEVAIRDDGDEGEIVIHDAKTVNGIPAHIQYPERLVVVGGAFIRSRNFERLNTSIVDESGEAHKNDRNLAAGSARLRDAGGYVERCIAFMPFNTLESFDDLPRKSERLKETRPLSFTPYKYLVTKRPLTQTEIEDGIKQLQQHTKDSSIPIDGIAVTYNDIAFSRRCGHTGYRYKNGLAFKFKGRLSRTTPRSVEWTPERTSEIAPAAIFVPVEIEGCEATRVSLHNPSLIEDLELMSGNRILVSKRNMIIPYVEENMDRDGFNLGAAFPYQYPCCGRPTRVHETKGRDENGKERIIKTLFCDNATCETRKLKKFVHFVNKKTMNIEELSEATLEKLISRGWIHSYPDLYWLDQRRDEIIRMEGFGVKS